MNAIWMSKAQKSCVTQVLMPRSDSLWFFFLFRQFFTLD